jgi:hypothetical protein
VNSERFDMILLHFVAPMTKIYSSDELLVRPHLRYKVVMLRSAKHCLEKKIFDRDGRRILKGNPFDSVAEVVSLKSMAFLLLIVSDHTCSSFLIDPHIHATEIETARA